MPPSSPHPLSLGLARRRPLHASFDSYTSMSTRPPTLADEGVAVKLVTSTQV